MPSLRILQPHVRFGDPQVTTDDAGRLSIRHALFEPLVRRAPSGVYRPCLAERWMLSGDACTWTFRLRNEVVFHDGKLLTAGDVLVSLIRIRDENVGGELGTSGVFQSYLAGSTITVPDAHTVVLTTPEPMADLLDLLVDIPILSKEAVAALPEAFIGTGPYRLAERDDTSVRMVRHEAYRAVADLPEVLVWEAVADALDRLERLTAGKADLITDVPPSARHRVEKTEGTRLLAVQTSVCATFMCNLFEGPCTDRAVRQALNYALDVPTLIRDVMHGAARPLTGPLTSLHLGFDPAVPAYGFDPQRARDLLGGRALPITLDVPTVLPDEAVELAARMAEYYADVGITTTVVSHEDRPAYAERVRAKRIHDAACFDSSPRSTFRVLREKFHAGLAGPWWLGYDNPEVNRLIDTARATIDPAKRQVVYRQAYRLLHTDAPWIFLYNPIRYLAAGPAVDAAWQPSAEGLITFS